MKAHWRLLGYAAFALAAAASPGRATTSIFTDAATFITDNFKYSEAFDSDLEAHPASPWSSPAPSTDNYSVTSGFQFTVTPAWGGLNRIGASAQDYALATDTPGSSMTTAFPQGYVHGVKEAGARFYLTDDTGAFVYGDVTITLNNGTTETLFPLSPQVGSFCGFISTDVITSATISSSTTNAYITVDDVCLSNPDSPRQLNLIAQPITAGSNAAFPVQPSFTILTSTGAIVPDCTGAVTISLGGTGTTSSACMSGTTTADLVNGAATFTNLSIDRPTFGAHLSANYQLWNTDSLSFDVALATYGANTMLTDPTASVDGVVYFGDSSGVLHAVDTSTGAVVFNTDIKADNGVAPPNPDRKALGRITRWNLLGIPRIFCVSSDNYLMVFDTAGNPLWTTQLEGGGTAVDACAMAYNDALYVAAANQTDTVVSKLDAFGSVTGHQHFTGTASSTVSVYGDSVFFSTPASAYRLQTSDLMIRNSYAAGVAPPFVASTGTANPVAIVVTSDGHVNAYSANTGNAVTGFGTEGSTDLEIPANVFGYINPAAFIVAMGASPLYVEDFGSLGEIPGSSWTSPLNNGMQFTASSGAGSLKRLSTNTTPYCLSTDTAGSSVTLTFTGGVTAVGGRFFVTNDAGVPVSDQDDLTVMVNGVGHGSTDPGKTPFRGYYSTTGISTLTISTPSTTSHISMDDIRLVRAPRVAAAPFVYGGKIYVGGMDNNVYCLNLQDGSAGAPNGTKLFFDGANMLGPSAFGAGAIAGAVSVCPSGSGSLIVGGVNGIMLTLQLSDGAPIGIATTWSGALVVPEAGTSVPNGFAAPITTASAYDPITQTFCFGVGNSLLQMSSDTQVPMD
jgi:outer membrane protein assembly factor BamB